MDADGRGFTDADHTYVTQCLGKPPTHVASVAVRDPAGRPVVIVNQPMRRKGQRWIPFPTLYWMVDPTLSAAIAEAERTGGVRAIEQLLEADPALMLSHLDDNRRYAAARMAVVGPELARLANQHDLLDVLEQSGIGGVANHRAVKCLHAQYAYHLARDDDGTTVGRLIEERYGVRFQS